MSFCTGKVNISTKNIAAKKISHELRFETLDWFSETECFKGLNVLNGVDAFNMF